MAIAAAVPARRPLWHYWIAALGIVMAAGALLAVAYAVTGAGRALPGFLGTNARFLSDLNLVMQILMAVTLLVGVAFIRRGNVRAHQYTQTIVVLTNLVLIAFVMGTTLFTQVLPETGAGGGRGFAPIGHAVVGTVAELLGLYLVLRMNNLVPSALRINNIKLAMRVTLALWLLTAVGGVVLYVMTYVGGGAEAQARSGQSAVSGYGPAYGSAPSSAAQSQGQGAPAAGAVSAVSMAGFAFAPKEFTVRAGATVTFTNRDGAPHTITADGGQFDSGTIAGGGSGPVTFRQAGTFRFFCRFHGGANGQGMSGTVTVQP